MLKSDIINLLGRTRGFSRYLEICTPTTGNRFHKVDRRRYCLCRRIVYCSSSEFSQGHDWDIHIKGQDIDERARVRIAVDAPYDAILVDPWHGYDASLRDLRFALGLLAPAGAIIVHDCSPPTIEVAGPAFRTSSWCGLTYAALINFALSEPELNFSTVDTDFGCAVIERRGPEMRAQALSDAGLIAGWRASQSDWRESFAYLNAHRRELLHLISVDQFLEREGLSRWARLRLRLAIWVGALRRRAR